MAKKKVNSKELVRLALDKHKWINTPVVYTTFGQNFTLFQQDVMLMVSGKLQGYIKQFLDESRYRDPDNPKPIFTPEQISQGIGDIRIELSELKVADNHYATVDNALEALRQLWVRAPVFDKDTGKRVGDDWYPVFEKVFVPASSTNAGGERHGYKTKDNREVTRREGYIDVTINHQVAAYVFDMSHGYFNHLERIALFCHSAYTSRLYMFLMRFVSRGQLSPVVPYMDLKDFLGMVEHDRKTNDIISEKYEKFSQFRKQVLDVAQKDMLRLSDDLKTEIIFEYEPVYRGLAKRGNPVSIKFHIKRTDLGVAREARLHRQTLEKRLTARLLADYPEMKADSLKLLLSTVDDEHFNDFATFARNDLGKVVDAPHRWGGTVSGYAFHLLQQRVMKYEHEKPTLITGDADDPVIQKAWKETAVELEARLGVSSDMVSFRKYVNTSSKRTLILNVRNADVIKQLECDDNFPVYAEIIQRHWGNITLQYSQMNLF